MLEKATNGEKAVWRRRAIVDGGKDRENMEQLFLSRTGDDNRGLDLDMQRRR